MNNSDRHASDLSNASRSAASASIYHPGIPYCPSSTERKLIGANSANSRHKPPVIPTA